MPREKKTPLRNAAQHIQAETQDTLPSASFSSSSSSSSSSFASSSSSSSSFPSSYSSAFISSSSSSSSSPPVSRTPLIDKLSLIYDQQQQAPPASITTSTTSSSSSFLSTDATSSPTPLTLRIRHRAANTRVDCTSHTTLLEATAQFLSTQPDLEHLSPADLLLAERPNATTASWGPEQAQCMLSELGLSHGQQLYLLETAPSENKPVRAKKQKKEASSNRPAKKQKKQANSNRQPKGRPGDSGSQSSGSGNAITGDTVSGAQDSPSPDPQDRAAPDKRLLALVTACVCGPGLGSVERQAMMFQAAHRNHAVSQDKVVLEGSSDQCRATYSGYDRKEYEDTFPALSWVELVSVVEQVLRKTTSSRRLLSVGAVVPKLLKPNELAGTSPQLYWSLVRMCREPAAGAPCEFPSLEALLQELVQQAAEQIRLVPRVQ